MAMVSDSQAYRVPEDVRILNEVDVAMWLVTYHPQDVRWIWSNKESLDLWNKKDLKEFVGTDIFSNRSAAVMKVHNEAYRMIQIERKTKNYRRTFYPAGKKAVTVDGIWRPLRIINDRGTEETVILVVCRPVEDDDDKIMHAGKQEVNRSHDMLQHTPVMTSMFFSTGEYIQSNVTSRNYYSGFSHRLELKNVLDACEWDNSQDNSVHQDRHEVLARIQALKLGDQAIAMQKRKLPREELSAKAKKEAGTESDNVPFVWHDMSFIPTVDPESAKPAIMVIENDVTQLETIRRQLIASAKQQEQFFAAVSHELRTPLNGIIGLTGLLIEDCEEKESMTPRDCVDTLDIVLSSAQRLNMLINDILDAAAFKQGTMKIVHGQVDVEDAIKQVCKQLSVLCNEGVQLKHHETPDLPPASGDTRRVCQIITNLIGNALKFTEKGTVEVMASLKACGKIIDVRVIDTGIGISPADLTRIFKPFQQADMSSKRLYEGTGLGLALVQNLVERHGGHIMIESELGHGTVIGFTLNVFGAGETKTELDVPRNESEDVGESEKPLGVILQKPHSEFLRTSFSQSPTSDSARHSHDSMDLPMERRVGLTDVSSRDMYKTGCFDRHGSFDSTYSDGRHSVSSIPGHDKILASSSRTISNSITNSGESAEHKELVQARLQLQQAAEEKANLQAQMEKEKESAKQQMEREKESAQQQIEMVRAEARREMDEMRSAYEARLRDAEKAERERRRGSERSPDRLLGMRCQALERELEELARDRRLLGEILVGMHRENNVLRQERQQLREVVKRGAEANALRGHEADNGLRLNQSPQTETSKTCSMTRP